MTRISYTDEDLRNVIDLLDVHRPFNGDMNEKIKFFLNELLTSREKSFVPAGIPGEEELYEPEIIDTDNALELKQNFAFPARMYRFRPTTKNNLFVDMDGTIAHWRRPDEKYVDYKGDVKYFHQEDIYDKGYFYVLPPEQNVVDAVKQLIREDNGLDVYILSAVDKNSCTALSDKTLWLKEYLPEIPKEKCVFLPCGTKKVDYLNLELTDCNILLDDYTKNLQEFTTGKVNNLGIKILNGINDSHGSWKGDRTSGLQNPEKIVEDIMNTFLRQKEGQNR